MPQMSADDSLITMGEVAKLLGVSVRTAERLQADGDLTPVYLPTTGRARLRRFRRSEIEARIARVEQVSA